MAAAEVADAPRNEKAGWCSMCRSDMHSMCASASCTCPDKRRHRGRPGFAGRDDAQPTPIDRARKASPPASVDKPVFRLRKEEPPEPPRKLTLSDQLLPMLASIEDGDWYSVAECPTSRGAGVMAGKCRKLGIPGWEWRAAGEKVYVRKAER